MSMGFIGAQTVAFAVAPLRRQGAPKNIKIALHDPMFLNENM